MIYRRSFMCAAITAAALTCASSAFPHPAALAARMSTSPALTAAQLVRLHAVQAWDVEFSQSVTASGTGSSTGPAFLQGRYPATFTRTETASGSLTTVAHFTLAGENGPSDCDMSDPRPPSPCVPKLSFPVQISSTAEGHGATTIDYTDGCEQQDGVSVGPGTTRVTHDFSTSNSYSAADLSYDRTTSFGFTAHGMGIDYTTNPPRFTSGNSNGIQQSPVLTRARTDVTDVCSRPRSVPPTVSLIDHQPPHYLFLAQDGADFSIRVVGGRFVASGSFAWTDPRCGYPAQCGSGVQTGSVDSSISWTMRERGSCLPIPADALVGSNGNRSNPDPAVADNMTDSDGDGIPDCWERDGIKIERANGGGVLTVPLTGADPNHKDVFVEADYMQGHRPLDAGLADVVTAFAHAPVANPDGSSGINLHAQVDDSAVIPEVANLAFDLPHDPASFPSDFWSLKSGDPSVPCDGNFGTASDRNSPDCALILAAKQLVYHYALFGNGALDQATGQPSFRGGISEEGGNDLNVTIGSWSQEAITDGTGLRAVEARTFMHELGHNLGLDHGGDQIEPTSDDITHTHNCKPNYLSVMNYLYAQRIAGLDPNQPLDYSRAALPTLNQDQLDERAGIGGPPDWQVIFGVGGMMRAAAANGPVDWNGDQAISADPLVGETDRLTDIGDCNRDSSVGRYVAGNTVVRHVGSALDPQFVPPASAFAVTATSSGAVLTVTAVAVVGDSLRLALATSPASVHVAYTRPAENALRLEDGTFAPSFGYTAAVRPNLTGYNDWAHLSFNFRDYTPNGLADGIGVLAHPNTPDVTAAQVVTYAQAALVTPLAPTPPQSTPPTTPRRADLAVRVDAEHSLQIGKSYTYTITVSNSGPEAATNVSLRDVLPPLLNATSAVASQGSCSGTATIACSLGSIANGGLATVVVSAAGVRRGSGTNTISASAAEDDPSTTNNVESATVLVHQPPVLARAGSAFAPPLTLRRGRAAGAVAAELTIDEDAVVNVSMIDRRRGIRLELLPGSRLGAIPSGRAHHSLTGSIEGTTPFVVRLFIPLRAVVHGHAYVIVVRALDSNGDPSELRLPVQF